MIRERRRFPRVAMHGEAYLTLQDEVYVGKLLDIAPAGVQMECQQMAVDGLAAAKNDAGLYPRFELLFSLPTDSVPVSANCSLNYSRRIRQDTYQLGIVFDTLSPSDDVRIGQYLQKQIALEQDD